MQVSGLRFQELYKIKSTLVFIIAALLFTSHSNAQFKIPEKPSNKTQTFVYDYISLLSKNENKALANTLKRYADTTSTQIVIAIINSTHGENINILGAQWGHKWGIGQKKEDNGILILVAKQERKIAISAGYGVEHILTDALSKRIIENEITPFFKQNNYSGGLRSGVKAILKVLNGEYKATPKTKANDFPVGFLLMVIFIIIVIILSNKKGGGKGNKDGSRFGSGSDLLDIIILSSMGRSNSSRGSTGWGGGSGGGGFGGGFGGGGFGGGGASGGW